MAIEDEGPKHDDEAQGEQRPQKPSKTTEKRAIALVVTFVRTS